MSLTGSQKEMGIPGMGIGDGGLGHEQITCRGLGVSSPLATVMPEIVMGKIHFQQISEIGLTNRPAHLAEVCEGLHSKMGKRRRTALKKFIWTSPLRQPL